MNDETINGIAIALYKRPKLNAWHYNKKKELERIIWEIG